MEKDERDIEFEARHFAGNVVEEAYEEVRKIKEICNHRLDYGYQKLKTIRKELRLLTRMTQCHRTRSEMFRLSEDIKSVYERLGNKL